MRCGCELAVVGPLFHELVNRAQLFVTDRFGTKDIVTARIAKQQVKRLRGQNQAWPCLRVDFIVRSLEEPARQTQIRS